MVLGLPNGTRACLFDLDGVITDTATVHTAAWEETFDALLRRYEVGDGSRRFVPGTGFAGIVDGRPRVDTVRSFLSERGIELPEGTPDGPADLETVHGVSRWQSDLFDARLRTEGAEVCDDTMDYLTAARGRGLLTAVATSSVHCREILRAAGAETLFDAWIDGVVAARRHLRGKPHPDIFLAAARDLGQHPSECAVFEDALAGMDAARSGRFGWVVGVDRARQADALYAHGANQVVTDLTTLIGATGSGLPA
ncbi:HAD family hydrolase [Streptomyces tendae]|uniref:HAD family hydrolase n=1 Tax=Streptomyces tendae TaxID=1932 RepID=UPI003D72A40C